MAIKKAIRSKAYSGGNGRTPSGTKTAIRKDGTRITKELYLTPSTTKEFDSNKIKKNTGGTTGRTNATSAIRRKRVH
jgi:hypothetical protein